MNKRSFNLWMAECHLRILVGWVLSIIVLFGAVVILARNFLALGGSIGTVYSLPVIHLVLLIWSSVSISKDIRERARRGDKSLSGFGLPSEQSMVERIRRLSVAGGHSVPHVTIHLGLPFNGFRLNAGLLDMHLGIEDHVIVDGELLRHLNTAETDAVLAHELGHKNRFSNKLKLAEMALRSGVVSLMLLVVAYVVLGVLDNPQMRSIWSFLAFVQALAVRTLALMLADICWGVASRSAEHVADAHAALVMGSPEPLISGLKKIRELHSPVIRERSFFDLLVATHPPIEERERRLRSLFA